MVDKQQLAAMGERMREMEECKPEFKVPDGWRLVPVEPNHGMIVAAASEHEGDFYLPVSLYKAMLAAAPEYKPEQAKPEFCESVMRSIPEPEAKPTIEQLASDYRNAKDYANRKQQEADAAKTDVEAKLAELVAIGKALGLVLSVAGVEPELGITVKVGDEVECVKPNIKPSKYKGMIGTVLEVDDSSIPYLVDFEGMVRIWCHEVKFIRRP